ncbi:MAG: FapA family protein [Chitinispirillaceae bacterium]|nr:FapA family protein [Chitinispirillaceae bacterium]
MTPLLLYQPGQYNKDIHFIKERKPVGSGITVVRSSDNMTAMLLVFSQRETEYPSCDEMLAELAAKGVIAGIDLPAIQGMTAEKVVNVKVPVANGVAAVPGTPGRIEVVVDTSAAGKPKTLADGRADFHDIGFVVNVAKGDVLARRIPPVPGTDGKTVLGTPVRPPALFDPELKAGSGTIISSDDPNVLLADTDGGFQRSPDGTIEVNREKVITGDIDYQTGDIDFSGNLTIGGTVRSGFSVSTDGSLLIGGRIEDCRITCGKNIVIRGGAVGSGSGIIECKGDVKVRHLEHFSLTADGAVTVTEDIMQGIVTSRKLIMAKSILGGTVTSWAGVEADSIGSPAEIRTVIDIGMKYEMIQQREDLHAKLESLSAETCMNNDLVFQFVRNHLDGKGYLSYDDEKILETMKQKILDLKKAEAAAHARLQILDSLEISPDTPYVRARVIYPNTIIKFGVGTQLIKQKLEMVRLLPEVRGTSMALVQQQAT